MAEQPSCAATTNANTMMRETKEQIRQRIAFAEKLSAPASGSGAELIARERLRQMEKEGWDAENDARYTNWELPNAAEAYIEAAGHEGEKRLFVDDIETRWPWDPEWFKPGKPVDGLRCLVKAGALIAAEIDRRLAAQRLLNPEPCGGTSASA